MLFSNAIYTHAFHLHNDHADVEPPIISDMPENIQQDVDEESETTTVTWSEPTVSDNSGSITLTSSHKPGDSFPIGNTTVTYTAEDMYSNVATGSFVITVFGKLITPLTSSLIGYGSFTYREGNRKIHPDLDLNILGSIYIHVT